MGPPESAASGPAGAGAESAPAALRGVDDGGLSAGSETGLDAEGPGVCGRVAFGWGVSTCFHFLFLFLKTIPVDKNTFRKALKHQLVNIVHFGGPKTEESYSAPFNSRLAAPPLEDITSVLERLGKITVTDLSSLLRAVQSDGSAGVNARWGKLSAGRWLDSLKDGSLSWVAR